MIASTIIEEDVINGSVRVIDWVLNLSGIVVNEKDYIVIYLMMVILGENSCRVSIMKLKKRVNV